MSTQAVKWAWDIPVPTASARLVLIALAEHADPEGVCYPSIARLAKMSQQSADTVRRRLREFEGWGILSKVERQRPDGSQSSNEYRLQLARKAGDMLIDGANDVGEAEPDGAPPAADPPSQSASPPSHGARGPSHSSARGPLAPVPPHEPSGENIPPLAPQGPSIADLVKVYPIPIVNMAKAEAVWAGMPEPDRLAAIEAAPRYGTHCRDSRKVPVEAHRYLARRSWEGFPAVQAMASSERVFVAEGSEQWAAWMVFRSCYRGGGMPTTRGPGGSQTGWGFPSEWPPFGAGMQADAVWVEQGSRQWWAWQERLRECDPVTVRCVRRARTGTDETGDQGWRFPSEWPPPKGNRHAAE